MIDNIEKIEKVSLDSKRYDIEVGVNHNFYANDILVHNCQNVPRIFEEFKDSPAYISVKVDGTSSTFIVYEDDIHVCSRNQSLKEIEGNTYWEIFHKYNIKEIIEKWKVKTGGKGLAIQGEIAGPGIQKNRLKLTKIQLFVFDIYDIENKKYFSYQEMVDFCDEYGLMMVPIDAYDVDISKESVESLLNISKGTYPTGGIREGIVVRPMIPKYSPSLRGRLSVKAINNEYLL
jgi:RNA ligase (TIGR02306 family)